MTDNTPMPFGKHKGTLMKDVPKPYLTALYYSQIRYRSYGAMADVLYWITNNLIDKKIRHERNKV